MADFIIPTARAVFLCFHVTEIDEGTAHYGWVFDAIRPQTYPHSLEMLCVVVQLSDGLGTVPVTVDVVRLSETPGGNPRRLRSTAPTTIHFPSRLTVVRAILRLTNCVFREPGTYLVEVHCGEVCVGDALLHLRPLVSESEP